jgi:hypothetical protein
MGLTLKRYPVEIGTGGNRFTVSILSIPNHLVFAGRKLPIGDSGNFLTKRVKHLNLNFLRGWCIKTMVVDGLKGLG